MDLGALRSLLGAGGVLTADDGIERFVEAARWANGSAAFVARPACTAEVAAVVRWAGSEGVRLVPQGANTGLVGASVPDASGTMGVLSLSRLTAPLTVDASGRSAHVGAGVTLSALNAAAAEHGLTFPIDLGADPSIGGMVATNTGGSRLLRYGDVRHNLLGLEVVTGAGAVLDLRSALRKANTGFDAKQVFVGTGGEFGVVTEVVVGLHPLPTEQAAALAVVASTEAAMALLSHLEREAGPALSAFELMSGAALRAVVSADPGLRHPFGASVPDVVVLAEVSNLGADDLAAFLASAPPGVVDDAFIDTLDAAWGIRHRISESLRTTGSVLAFDVSVARSELPALRSRAVSMVAERDPSAVVCDFGHAGDGGLHLNLWWPAGAKAPAGPARAALRDAVYDLVVSMGGSFSAEHGLGPANQAYARRYLPAGVQELAGVLKRHFDPAGVLGTLDWSQ